MDLTLSADELGPVLERLSQANRSFDCEYPHAPIRRQPVHTVYGGAQRFRAGTAAKLGAIARETMGSYLPDATALAEVTGMSPGIAQTVHARVSEKLEREPVEDFRIDFEDGYGHHSEAEEDAHAAGSAAHLAQAIEDGGLPPFIGIRVKSFSTALWQRGMRTLDLFLTALLAKAGALPPNFVVTLPKVTSPAQAAALHEMLLQIEARFELQPRSIAVELMLESPQIVINEKGVCGISALIAAASKRCRGLHFGPYDYTSAIGIPGSHQSLHHPSCDFARHVMQAATAGTGVLLSDGPTKTIPIAPDPAAVHHAMRVHYDDVRRSLHHGFFQSWDLHPAQFPMRYAAVYSFFLEDLETAAGRLRHFLDAAAQATTLGMAFDDAASAQGLLNFVLQGQACGAFQDSDLYAHGLLPHELRKGSFAEMMKARHS